MPHFSIVIVTWNSQQVLGPCVDSIFRHLPPGTFEVVLVDNASRDGSYLDTFAERPGVIVVRNGDNLGYAKAVNIGLRRAAGDFRIILNPDMEFLSNPLPRLVAELRKDPSIGAIAPLLYGADGRPQIEHFYPDFPSVLQFVLLRSLLGKLGPMRRLAVRHLHARVGTSGMHFVDQIPGAFLMFHRDLFGGKAGLEEAYFIWMEDVDFCLRLRKAGLKAAVVADERILHIGGTSFKMVDVPRKKLMFTRSFMTFLDLHHGLGSYLAHAFLMSANSLAIAFLMTAVHLPRLSLKEAAGRVRLEAKVLGIIGSHLLARLGLTRGTTEYRSPQ